MLQSRAERIKELLDNLRNMDPDIEGLVVASREGLVISSSLTGEMDDDKIAAFSASMGDASTRTFNEFDKREPTEILARSPEGLLFIFYIGNTGFLIAVTRPTKKIGLLFIDLRKTAEEIKKILES